PSRTTGAHGVVPTNEVITAQAASQFGAQSAYITVVINSLATLRASHPSRTTGAHGVVPTNEVITAQAASQFGAQSAYI
ncbi:hypothetical protein CTI14_68625, partial [Methylobacterium radiotolerans]